VIKRIIQGKNIMEDPNAAFRSFRETLEKVEAKRK
jgi:hypothetical protein